MTIYARKLRLLAILLSIILAGALLTKSSRVEPRKPKAKKEPVKKVAYRGFVTLYRSQMLILTVTAILAVDFPIFPRAFSKTETWGTSLMDLGVGSFVFSLGVVSSRKAFKDAQIGLVEEARQSISQTLKLLLLGFARLASLKLLNYQEHVSEYGVHWNFFFTIGLLPLAFTFFNRIPGGLIVKATALAFGYEITLKNTGLQDWALWGARQSLVSQNKEGIVSFVGYLAIFSFGYIIGRTIMNPQFQMKQIILSLTKWTVATQALFLILRTATEPSRRIVNLPYIFWVVSYNAGCLTIFALLEYLVGLEPSASLLAVNKHGQLVFLVGNFATGAVNIFIDTLDVSTPASLAILIGYQEFVNMMALYLNK